MMSTALSCVRVYTYVHVSKGCLKASSRPKYVLICMCEMHVRVKLSLTFPLSVAD